MTLKLKFKLDVSQAFVLQSRLLSIDMRQGVQRPFFHTIVSYIVSPYGKLHLENRIRILGSIKSPTDQFHNIYFIIKKMRNPQKVSLSVYEMRCMQESLRDVVYLGWLIAPTYSI
jgi:hypothetical protein